MGFFDIDRPGEPARVGLEQVSDDRFALLAGFTFRAPDGSVHHVFPWHLPETDLTSIPKPFRWFEGRHGRHTLAALLHDHQVAVGPDDPDDSAYWRRRTIADDRFRDAMAVLGVPVVRRNVMWSAVHFITRLRHHGRLTGIGMLLWLALSLAGTWVVLSSFVLPLFGITWSPTDPPAWVVRAALAGPVVAALALWVPWDQLPAHRRSGEPIVRFVARRWSCGVVMGIGILALGPTGVLAAVADAVPRASDAIGGWGPSPWPPRDDGSP